MSHFNNQKEISLKFPSWKEVVIEYSKKELGSETSETLISIVNSKNETVKK